MYADDIRYELGSPLLLRKGPARRDSCYRLGFGFPAFFLPFCRATQESRRGCADGAQTISKSTLAPGAGS